jgi:hypothetical protein
MNAENPVQIDLFGASATRTKDTRLAEQVRRLVSLTRRLLSKGNHPAISARRVIRRPRGDVPVQASP